MKRVGAKLAKRPEPVGLLKVEEAKKLLAHCERVDEAKAISDKARAIKVYFKQRKDGQAAAGSAAEIVLRADRRAGELLLAQEKAKGTRGQLKGRSSGGSSVQPPEKSNPSYRDLGIDKTWAKWSQDLARIDSDTFEAAIEEKKKEGERSLVSLTTRDLVAVVREEKRTEKHASIAEQSRSMPSVDQVQRCPVVYADPPWQYGNTAGVSAAEDEYPTMPLADICAMQVPATKDAVLFLWATSPLLPEAFEVIRAWGFTYKASVVWDKDMGTGNWVLNCHELLLIAVRGDMPCPAPANRPKSVVRAKRGAHSAKPEEFASLIERMFPALPKVELFRRGPPRPGWIGWGNQAA